MEQLNAKFNAVKEMLLQRAATVMPEPMLKVFMATLDDYQTTFVAVIKAELRKESGLKEENNLLRDLVGISDTAIKARLLEQGEEIRFLREQLITVKRELDAARQQNDEVRLKLEERQNELLRFHQDKEQDNRKYQASLEKLSEQLLDLDRKSQERFQEWERERERIARGGRDAGRNMLLEAEEELRVLVTGVRALGGVILGTSQFCMERWEQLRKAPPDNREQLTKQEQDLVSESLPDVELMFQNSREISRVLDSYAQILAPRQPRWDKMDWPRFWEELRKKFASVASIQHVTINFPAEKQYPPFSTDEKILLETCEIVIQNALETLGPGGGIEVKGRFSSAGVVLRIFDDGPPAAAEAGTRLFYPFTAEGKFNHKNLKLAKALRLTRVLGGSVLYEPVKSAMPRGIPQKTGILAGGAAKTGNQITISIPCQ